jgi:hypothetical protein
MRYAINQTNLHGFLTSESTCFQGDATVVKQRDLLSEQGREWPHKRRIETELVDAYPAFRTGTEAVVVGHGEHDAAGKGMAVYKSERRHGVPVMVSLVALKIGLVSN